MSRENQDTIINPKMNGGSSASRSENQSDDSSRFHPAVGTDISHRNKKSREGDESRDVTNLAAEESQKVAVSHCVYRNVQVTDRDILETRKDAEEFLKLFSQTEEDLLSSSSDSLCYSFQEVKEGYMVTTATLARYHRILFKKQTFMEIFRTPIKISSGYLPGSPLRVSAPNLFDLNQVGFRSVDAIMKKIVRMRESDVANGTEENTAAAFPIVISSPSQSQVYRHEHNVCYEKTPLLMQIRPRRLNPNCESPQSLRMHSDVPQLSTPLDTLITRFGSYCNLKSNDSLSKSTLCAPVTNPPSQRYPVIRDPQLSQAHGYNASANLHGIRNDEINRTMLRGKGQLSVGPLVTSPSGSVNEQRNADGVKEKLNNNSSVFEAQANSHFTPVIRPGGNKCLLYSQVAAFNLPNSPRHSFTYLRRQFPPE